MCTAVTVPAKTPRIGASPCWFSPIIASLETEVEPNCKLCDCTMDSWDLYFDHLIFDPNHKLNEYREMTEQRYSRFKQNISHAQKRILGSPSRYSRIVQSTRSATLADSRASRASRASTTKLSVSDALTQTSHST